MIRVLFAVVAFFSGSHTATATIEQPLIAIIMDDVGYRSHQDRDAMMLPGPLTISILPHAPGADRALRLARARDKEVMVHLPMQSARHNHHHIVPGTLTRDMDWATFVDTVRSSLSAMPGAVAVNNHEGSLLTADSERMHWLMHELSQHRNLFFIDSRTTHHTVALDTARQYGLQAARRDIFLDHEPGRIEEQFEKLIRKAKRRGTALAIAHPYPETVDFLRRKLPELDSHGIKLVKLTDMIRQRQQTQTRGS